jgi:hypothetical protein
MTTPATTPTGLTGHQRNYLIERINKIAEEKICAKQTAAMVGRKGCAGMTGWASNKTFNMTISPSMTMKDFVEAIKTDQLVPSPMHIEAMRAEFKVSDFSGPLVDKVREDSNAVVKEVRDYITTINTRKQEILDQLILGDSAKALQMLEDFTTKD